MAPTSAGRGVQFWALLVRRWVRADETVFVKPAHFIQKYFIWRKKEMKRRYLFLVFIVFLLMGQPAFADLITHNGVVEILSAADHNPFEVRTGYTYDWTAVYDESDIGECVDPGYPDWLNDILVNTILLNAAGTEGGSYLTINIGDDWVFADGMDIDASFGLSALYFYAGSVLNGVDALTDYLSFTDNGLSNYWDGATSTEYAYFAFTTNTPLPGGDPANFNATSFSIFAATDASGSNQLEIVSGKLMDPVPEPGTAMLLGVGLLGALACFRKRAR